MPLSGGMFAFAVDREPCYRRKRDNTYRSADSTTLIRIDVPSGK